MDFNLKIPCHNTGKHQFLGTSMFHSTLDMKGIEAPLLDPFQLEFPKLKQITNNLAQNQK